MDEDILPAVVRRDEPESLVLIEKLDRTRCHEDPRKLSGIAPAASIFATRDTRNLTCAIRLEQESFAQGFGRDADGRSTGAGNAG
ncbi:hypothetical protein [Shinella zoogloeoides]